jgi:hypothetical protein
MAGKQGLHLGLGMVEETVGGFGSGPSLSRLGYLGAGAGEEVARDLDAAPD